MKKHHFLSLLFATCLILVSFHGVHAQNSASISGDELCGATAATKCTFANIKTIAQKMLYTFVAIGSVGMFIFIAYRLLQSQYAVMMGNAAARMDAGKKSLGAFQGLFIVVAVSALFLAALKLLGVQAWTTQLLQLFSDAFIPHVYAADQRLLPNPLMANNIFDLIMAIMSLVIKFFIYPAIIALWVWSGFQFVYSQGNPAGLQKAKSWLLWTVIVTTVIFTLQGFLLALKNTALKIAPQNPAFIQAQPTNGNPAASSGTSKQPVTSCQGQSEGTACTVAGRPGTCTRSDSSESAGTFDCYATPGGALSPTQNCANIASEIQRDACFAAQK